MSEFDAESNIVDSFKRLKETVDRLRSPDGCVWDKQQTHRSLKPYLIEECYEVLQAIDIEDPNKLQEELGDLLLQIMLHSRIEEELGNFNIGDVMDTINNKLVYRHPHVFSQERCADLDEIKNKWHKLKQSEEGKEESVLAGIPFDMPALARSQLLQRKAASVGFDWVKEEDIVEKIDEEARELIDADIKQRFEEFGDILFVLVNLARRLDIDAETALRAANEKFVKRFIKMEQICRDRGLDFIALSLEDKNLLWDEAKKQV